MTAPPPPAIRPGAWFGALLGACGWALGLAVASLAAGRFDVLWQVALPGALVSLVLALQVLVAWLAVRARLGAGAPATRLVLAGSIAGALGVLLLLIHVWIEPVLDDPDFRGVLAATGSVTRLPLAMPLALASLAAGLVLLVLAARRLRRDW